MVRVKICGITSVRDARMALRAGADALGFVFAESPRQVTVTQARRIIRGLSPWVSAVGVFVNETPEKIRHIAKTCGLSAVQLHGDETPAMARLLRPWRVIKAFSVDEKFSLDKVRRYDVDAILLDTKIGARRGGTGQTFKWDTIKKMRFEKPVIVSGGLNATNVARAIRLLRPYGVDASSRLEKSPGKKDAHLVKEFISRAKKF